MPCTKTQHSDSRVAQTSDPSISSPVLYTSEQLRSFGLVFIGLGTGRWFGALDLFPEPPMFFCFFIICLKFAICGSHDFHFNSWYWNTTKLPDHTTQKIFTSSKAWQQLKYSMNHFMEKPQFNQTICIYSKTCVKRPLSKRPQLDFQYQLLLNAGQKYCRMLQGEHFWPSLSYHLSLSYFVYFWEAVLHRFHCT